MKRTLLVLALAVAMAAPAALAGGRKTEKNPVVNLTGHVNPGFWRTTFHGKHAGKSPLFQPSTDCITAADLKDFLNSSEDNPKVKKYSLHGNHLYVEAVRSGMQGASTMTLVQDIHFDSPNHMHGTFTVHGSYKLQGTTHKIHMVAKITSQRISSTCPKGPDD